MNQKKLIKRISLAAASLALLGGFSETIVLSDTPVEAASKKSLTKTVSFKVYKHKSKKTSMAQGFIGKKAKVVIKKGKVAQLILHVDGSKNKLGQGKDVSIIVKSLKINGKTGHKANIASDGSSFDFVFPGSAFKSGKKVSLKVTIDLGMKMNETADIKFGKVSGLKSSHKHPKKVSKKTKRSKKSKKSRSSHKKVSKKRSKRHRR